MAESSKPVDEPSETRRRLHRLESYVARLAGLLFVVAFLLVYFAPRMFITIHSGEVGVMFYRFFGGTQTDRLRGEGMQVILPWDHLYIYSTRVQETKADVHVLSKEGLAITLHLSIRYHPEEEMIGMLHKAVGTEYKDRVVIPEVESAMREIMGQFEMRQVYGSDQALVQKVINETLEQVSQTYVRIDDVVLRMVELPPKVADAIQEKMTQKELAEAYEYRLEQAKQEAARVQIEANGIKQSNDTLNSSLTPNILKWEAIQATKKLAESPNTKTIIMGNGGANLPVLLGSDK